jgi:hypothetical protein
MLLQKRTVYLVVKLQNWLYRGRYDDLIDSIEYNRTHLQASAYASQDGVLSEAMINARTAETMKQHETKMQWLTQERRVLAARDIELTMKTLSTTKVPSKK